MKTINFEINVPVSLALIVPDHFGLEEALASIRNDFVISSHVSISSENELVIVKSVEVDEHDIAWVHLDDETSIDMHEDE